MKPPGGSRLALQLFEQGIFIRKKIRILVVFCTDNFDEFLARAPGDVPADLEWSRIGARIVDRGLVVQGVVVGTREAFDLVM